MNDNFQEGIRIVNGENTTVISNFSIDKFLDKLGLNYKQSGLIRAFIKISEGRVNFEASTKDLANILYPSNSNRERSNYEKTRYAINKLLDWQKKNNLGLIQIVEKGSRKPTTNGTFNFHKTKYRFVLLESLQEVPTSNLEDFDSQTKELLKKLHLNYKPPDTVKKYHSRHQIRKDKMTILTKFKRVFKQYSELGENPTDECQKIIGEMQRLLCELDENYAEQQYRDQLIAEFETFSSDTNNNDLEDYKDISSNLYRAENYHLITTEVTNGRAM